MPGVLEHAAGSGGGSGTSALAARRVPAPVAAERRRSPAFFPRSDVMRRRPPPGGRREGAASRRRRHGTRSAGRDRGTEGKEAADAHSADKRAEKAAFPAGENALRGPVQESMRPGQQKRRQRAGAGREHCGSGWRKHGEDSSSCDAPCCACALPVYRSREKTPEP